MAKIVPKNYGRVAFGIDGLEDTHSIHRKGTDFYKILKNAKAYIDAGGEAQWSYLVFKHNQHQVEKARDLAKDLGFSSFQTRSTGRFFDQRNFEPMKSWQVKDKNDNKEYELYPADDPKYLNGSIQNFEKIKESHDNFFDYLDKVEVCCDALKGSKIIINHEGLVLPCGQLNENLYDGRFFEERYEPKVYLDEATGKPAQQFINMLDSYGRERLSIFERSLESVLQEKFYKDIMDSWNKKSIKEGKLFECSLSCGKKFTKWLDQNLEKRFTLEPTLTSFNLVLNYLEGQLRKEENLPEKIVIEVLSPLKDESCDLNERDCLIYTLEQFQMKFEKALKARGISLEVLV